VIPLRDANPTRRTPVVTLAIIVACFVTFAMELAIQATGGEAGLTRLFDTFGVVPVELIDALRSGDLLSLPVLSLITYQFLHGGWMHLGVNMITLAAFGTPVERLLGVRRFVVFYLSAGVVAGFIHVLFFPGSSDPVIGASGSISGVFGGVLMLMRYVGSLTSLLPVAGIWIGLNVFFGIFGGTPGAAGEQVAWVAHIGGFVYGLLVIRLFLPRHLRPPPSED